MTYIAYHFKIKPRNPGTEILIAELGQLGFESFVEKDNGLSAYIQQVDDKKNLLSDVYILNQKEFSIKFKKEEIPKVNWNAAWEEYFDPIQVDQKVSVRAPFHDNPGLEYDIVIEPKMSFGTGHHETTHMMIQHLLDLDLNSKSVLDMGCGTGVLAIFAAMKGAQHVEAIDIDRWCFENAVENCERNECAQVQVFEGDVNLLSDKSYDLIIANINRNILLADIAVYANCLTLNGMLLLSGFYKEDIPIIDKEVSKYGMVLNKTIERNNWVSLRYVLKQI